VWEEMIVGFMGAGGEERGEEGMWGVGCS